MSIKVLEANASMLTSITIGGWMTSEYWIGWWRNAVSTALMGLLFALLKALGEKTSR
jgi:hypothetical protein